MPTTDLNYTTAGTLEPMEREKFPALVRDSLDYMESGDDFGYRMASGDAQCIESYGNYSERIELWRVPGGKWYAFHDDGQDIDANIIISDVTAYVRFLSDWWAPMASKIMAADHYYEWQKKITEERATT